MATNIVVPELGESVSEATVGQWLKKPGEPVAVDDPLVELETDKVTLEVNAAAAGVLSEILTGEGENVEVGAVLGRIAENAGGASPAPTSAPTPAEATPPAGPAAPAPQGEERLSPAVRKLIEDHGLEASRVQGTGKNGRILKEDVLRAAEGKSAPADPPPDPAPTPPDAAPARTGAAPARHEERVRMTRLRRRIAERLKEAQNTAAILTTFNEVDMGPVMDLRRRFRESFERKHGVRLGFMSFFTNATIAALKELPGLNAQIDGEELVYKNYYDIGVAVSTPNGLVVPVLRDADSMSFARIEKTIAALGRKGRDGTLSIDEMTGGTFTITNGGVFGSMLSTPILNPPQSGILGLHKIQDRAMVVDGEVCVRPMMYLALSYDHRIVDGRDAVTFLVRVKAYIEDPERLLLDV